MPEPLSPADRPVLMDPQRSMKPLLALAIREALHLALIDSATPPRSDHADIGDWTPEQVAAMRSDIHAIPLDFDPEALAQNLACRLLGTGGWSLGDLYSPNATPQEVFDHSIDRPHRDAITEMVIDLGLRPEDEDV